MQKMRFMKQNLVIKTVRENNVSKSTMQNLLGLTVCFNWLRNEHVAILAVTSRLTSNVASCIAPETNHCDSGGLRCRVASICLHFPATLPKQFQTLNKKISLPFFSTIQKSLTVKNLPTTPNPSGPVSLLQMALVRRCPVIG
jgi:hypothetical protein